MKKVITLIIALLAFVPSIQVAHASLIMNLDATVESGIDVYDTNNFNVRLAIIALTYAGQIKYVLVSDDVFGFASTKTGKTLFTLSGEGIISVSADVTSDDDISYTITSADRTVFEEADIDEEMARYQTINMHFVPDSGGGENIDLPPLICNLQDGMELTSYENEDAYLAVSALLILGQIESNFDAELGLGAYSLATTGKVLFYMTSTGVVYLESSITSDDDIIYTITDADRRRLKGTSMGQTMETYGTIELHFLVKEGLKATLYNGLKYVENDDTHYAVLALVVYNQLSSIYHSDTKTYKYVNVATNKTLFTATLDYVVTIASDVTASDDLYYFITDEDRDYLFQLTYSVPSSLREEFTNLYWFLMSYETITLHFDVTPPVREGTLGNQGTWRFEDGVLTVDYIGAMPWNCTSKTTDPEIAYRLKWIDFLSEIKEIVITGVDVEIQPYFLYYEGDGPSGSHPDDHVRKLTLGSGVKKVGKQALTLYDLKDVYCYGIEPPVLSSDLGESNSFWKTRIQANQAFLHLVQGASTGYAMINSEWAFFNHSAHALDPADDPVGIKLIDNGQLTIDNEGIWYSLDGRKLSGKPSQKGIYIRGGKKVLIK